MGAIHGLANSFLIRHRRHTSLGSNCEVLDELTQLLFIFEHFDEITGAQNHGKFLGRWKTRWTAIEGTRNYFNKITEELIEPADLQSAEDPSKIFPRNFRPKGRPDA